MKRKIPFRLIALVLTLALFVQMAPMRFFASAAEEVTEATAQAIPTEEISAQAVDATTSEPFVVGEITEKRDVNVKHFRMSDGTIQACVYPEPVHYLENGTYQQIDNTLVLKTNNDKKHYENKANSFKVKLPEAFTEDYIELSDENGYVKFRLLGASNKSLEKHAVSSGKAKKDKTVVENVGSRAYYKSIKTDIDVSYDVTANGLKETIILNKKTKENFVFEIVTSAAAVTVQEDNKILFHDGDNNILYIMAAPFMVDAAGVMTNSVKVSLQKTDTGYLMEYDPDEDWLYDKARQYPVQLDPTLSPSTTALDVRDTYVFNEQSATNPPIRGYMDLINIGRRTETTSTGEQLILRGFFYFNNPVKLAETDCLISAKLTMIHNYAYSNVNGTQINLYALSGDFSEGTTHWHNQPDYYPELIDYAIVNTSNMLTETKSCDVYDITKLIQAWNNGDENHGVAFVLNNESSPVSSTQQVYYFARDSMYHGETAQFVSITYRDTRGLEGYWNYTTQDLGDSGMGYVNNYSGGLTYVHEDAVNATNHTAFTISHVYNSANRDADLFHGYGWNLNLCQTLEPVSLENNTAVKYVYTDGDGTQHYLVDTGSGIKDEDGLGYTYTPISNESDIVGKLTDKDGNILEFDTQCNLTTIWDSNGNYIDIQFMQKPNTTDYHISAVITSSEEYFIFYYNADYRLYQIRDNAYRNITFAYDSGKLTRVFYPDGTHTTYTYYPDTVVNGVTEHGRLQTVTHSTGYGAEYTYTNSQVTAVRAFGKSGADAGTTSFTYNYNQTKVTDPLGQYNVFQFDNAGHVTGVYNDRGQTCAQTFTTASHSATEIFKNNKVTSATGVTAYSNNLLQNGTFLNGLTNWTAAGTVSVEDVGYISAKSVRVSASGGYSTISQAVTTPAGKTYTLSAYVRVDSISSQSGIAVQAATNLGTYSSQWSASATDVDVDQGFRRISVTVPLQAGEYITSVSCGIFGATGTAYINAVSLEEGDALGSFNLVENSGFEQVSSSMPVGFTSAGSGNTISAESNMSGSYSFKVIGNVNENRNICQTISQSGKAGDVYTFGGWASIKSLPDNHAEHPAKMLLEVIYTDEPAETIEAPFNVTLQDTWQCTSNTFVAKYDYQSINLYFCYNKNSNYGYVDNVFLFRDTVQSYTYDSNGNVISSADKASQESSFEYTDNTLTRLIQPTGENFRYRYDENKNMVHALSGNGLGYSVSYDSYGNATKSVVEADNGNNIQNGRVYVIQSSSTGMYITAQDSQLSHLSDIGLGSDPGSDLAKFRAILVPEGYYVLRPIGSERAVLTYRSRYEENSPGEIDLVEPNETSIDWTHLKIVLADPATGRYNIIARMAEKGGHFSAVNGDVCLNYENGSASQMWYFREVEEDGSVSSQHHSPFVSGNTYYLRNVESGLYLSVSGSLVHTANVVQNKKDAAIQTWTITDLGGGHVILRPTGSDSLALTYISRTEVNASVDIESTGANVTSIDWSHWILHGLGDGSGAYRISAPAITNFANPTGTDHLAVEGSSHAAGGNVQVEAYSGLDSQKWVLVDANSKKSVTSATYTSNGAYVDTVTDALGNTTDYDYNTYTGLLTKVTNGRGYATDYTYNANNDNLTQVTTGSSSVSYTYNADGSLHTITTPTGTVYTFTYDNLGRTTDIRVGAQSLSTTTAYIGVTDLPNEVTYGNGTTRRYTYDAQYRLAAEYVGNTQTAAYTYDKLDRLIRFDDLASGITWEFSYDLIGRTTGIYASDGRYVGYQYDSFNRLLEMKEYVGGKVLETGYHYDDQSNHSYKTGLFRGIFLNGQRQLAYSYDEMSRRDKRVVMTTVPFVTEYTYYDGATAGTTSTVVKTLKNGDTTWEYAYDGVGNITGIWKNGALVESYSYDALNQLTSVYRNGDTYSYIYDASGNITAVTKNGSSYKSYTYGNTNWKDLLTAYNGTTITYDEIGNPLTYRDGFAFTWSSGRQLATVTNANGNYSYGYDASGLRTSKTVGGVTTQYYWLGDKLQAQSTGNEYLIFLYDEAGMPYGLIHKYGSTEITYYYEYNLQGDIIGIISDTGTRVVTYEYSAWGELLSISGSMASNIGATNPLRYRGYYYDSETGFYYLQSRYYDPVTCRFINEDSLISTGQGVLGYNMFAYCINDPVGRKDTQGTFGLCVALADDTNPFNDLGVVRGGGSAGGVSLGAAFGAAAVVAGGAALVSEAISSHKAKDEQRKTYSVYFLEDQNGVVQYVGRVTDSGYNARMVYHYKTRGLTPKWRISGLKYAEARGLEEIGMIVCHTLNPSNPKNNQIHGISPRNKNGCVCQLETA